MIKNYLKTAWRNLWKNKSFSTINIMGLALGLACSLLILLWVQNETDMDAFHANDKQLFSVYERSYFDNKVNAGYDTQALLPDELKKIIPDVKYASGFGWNADHTFQVGDKILKQNGTYAGADYFKMFTYPLLQGKAESALNTPLSIAISKKMADNLFGSPEQAIGKTVKYENKKNYKVSAVFDDLKANSSVKFDFLLSWDAFLQHNGWAKNWGSVAASTYIMLAGNANPAEVEGKLTHFLDNYNKNQKKGSFTEELGMQQYSQAYLHGNFENGKFTGGRIEYVHLFSIVAVFILLIACINFMNLATASSVKRAKEIGVRKVVGALRGALIKQFITESLLLTSLAVAISLIMLIVLLPFFNQITHKQIELPFNQSTFWLKLLLVTIITGLVSGSYPALFLSSFNPIKVLKGSLKTGAGTTFFRKGLVVFQFVLSVVLIIGTIIISRQVNYIQSINLGYNRENLVYVPLEGDLIKNYEIFKNEALKMPGISSVTRISSSITDVKQWTSDVKWDGKDPNLNVSFSDAAVGYDFIKTMKLQMVDGRDFSKDFGTDTTGFVINEAALKRLGYTNPVGKPLSLWNRKGPIVGVVKNFHFNSLHEEIKPLIIYYSGQYADANIAVRSMPGQTKQALASLQTLTRQLNPNFSFTYVFSDDEYNKLYNNEQIIGSLSNSFAFLAIFISCLGLVGLTMFTAEQRVKEIGIRKVLGAGVGSLFSLLSSEFFALVGTAFLIASPIAWIAMNKWLQNYAYHTKIEWWIFAVAGLISMLITVLTVGFQMFKAALVNPIKSLRSE
jgi:putative ABC transport system permease protein